MIKMPKKGIALRNKYLPALIALFLFIGSANAQYIQPDYLYGKEFNRGIFKYVLGVPIGLGSTNIIAGKDTAQIRYNKEDSSIRVWTGYQWWNPGGGGSSLTYPNTANKYLNGYGAFATLNTDSITQGTNKFVTAANIIDWNNAFGWGNHAGLYVNLSDSGAMLSPYFREVGYGLLKSGQTVRLDTATVKNYLTDNDTTILQTVLDSTGQAQHRVLFAAGNKIRSDGFFIYDSTNNKLVINHNNVSVGGPNTKLFVGGNAQVTGNLTALSLIKSGGTSSQFLKADGSVDANTYLTAASITGKLNISDTGTMLTPYFREVGYALAKSGHVVSFDSLSSAVGFHTQPYNDLRYYPLSGNPSGYLTSATFYDSTLMASRYWVNQQNYLTSFTETDPIAIAKTITNTQGSGILITGTAGQTLNSNPSWTFKADTALVATKYYVDNRTYIDNTFANANLTFTGDRTHDADSNFLKINNLSELEIRSYLSGTRYSAIIDAKPFYSGIGMVSVYDNNNGSGLYVNNNNNTSAVYMDAYSATSYSSIDVKPDSIKLSPNNGKLFVEGLTTAPGTKAVRWNSTTGLFSVADTTTGGSFYDSTLMASVQRLKDTALAIRGDFPTGGTPTLQQVLTAGSILTGANTIDGANHLLTISGTGSDLLELLQNPSSTNTVIRPLLVTRNTSNTAINGIGVGVEFSVEAASGGVAPAAGFLDYLYTDATNSTLTVNIDLTARNNGLLETFMNIQPGVIRVNNLADTLATKDYARSVGGGGAGEVNTASNLSGLGVGIWKDKSGVDLRFKRLKSGAGISITDNTDSVTIDNTGVITEADPLALKIASNLSDLNNAATARTNLGATTLGGNLFTITNNSATVKWLRINTDNTITQRTAAETLSDIGAQAAGSYQTLDADLTTIAGLTATTDNFIVSVASAWASRTPAQVRTTLGLVIGTNVQAFDSDLTTWAGLTPTTVGQNLVTLTNPSAITFIRINADNTVSALNAATFRTAIGAGTGDGTVTGVTGTTNRITSSGGAAPAIDIAATYVGQSSITTLGTITTGTWTGTDIAFANIAQAGANTVLTNPTTGTADITTTALSASNLLGRGSTGNIAAITVNGILSFSGTVLSATEVDGSTSNELQTITNSSDATSHTVTLSNSGGTIQLIEGTNITLTTGGTGAAGTLTISATATATTTTDNQFQINSNVLTANKAYATLTDGATITWDASTGYDKKVTLGGNRTLSITNSQSGDYGTLIVTQDTTGSRTLTVPNATITLNSAASQETVLTYTYDGTIYRWNVGATQAYSNASGSVTGLLTSTDWTTFNNKVSTSVTTLSSLVSIGTITTGTWNGTVISATYGGTGVNNGSSTITLAGNLVTSGAFSITLTATATTNITLPTTGTLATQAGAETLTNKRITKRVTTIASNATWSPSADTDDLYQITAQAAAATTISNPSGTPTEGQILIIRVKDDGTARALTWSGTQWRGSTDQSLPTTTTISKWMYISFMWNATDSKWDCTAVNNGF